MAGTNRFFDNLLRKKKKKWSKMWILQFLYTQTVTTRDVTLCSAAAIWTRWARRTMAAAAGGVPWSCLVLDRVNTRRLRHSVYRGIAVTGIYTVYRYTAYTAYTYYDITQRYSLHTVSAVNPSDAAPTGAPVCCRRHLFSFAVRPTKYKQFSYLHLTLEHNISYCHRKGRYLHCNISF